MTPREGVEPVAWAIRRDLPISGKGRFIAISNEPYDPSSIDDAEECVVPLYAHPAATARWEAWKAMGDTVDALLDAVRKFVKKDTPTGLMRLNDAMVAARDALALARSAGGM